MYGLRRHFLLCVLSVLSPLLLADEQPATKTLASAENISPATIRATVARLMAPADLAASEDATFDSPEDEEECISALRYGSDTRSGLRIVSTNLDYLKIADLQTDFEQSIHFGTLPDSGTNFFVLFCDDLDFALIQNMGRIGLKQFDESTWMIGDFGHESCGEPSAIVLAKQGSSLAAIAVPLTELVGTANTCLRLPKNSDKDCVARIRCLQDALGRPSVRSELSKSLVRAVEKLAFTLPKTR